MRRRTYVIAAVVAGLLPAAAEAKTFEVTRAGDPIPGNCKRNDCSLREAILAANERAGKDEIVLPGKRYELTRENPGGTPEDGGLSGDLDISNDPVVIAHLGKGKAKIQSEFAGDPVVQIFAGAATSMRKVAVTGGDNPGGDGGGILSEANLKLSKSAIVNNTADDGAGIDMDGDVKLTLKRSTVLRNDADDLAGGINTGSGTGDTLILRSRIAGNTATDTGGGLDGAGDLGTIRVVRSRIENNSSGDGAGGIDADANRVIVKQSSVAGNTTQEDGGGLLGTGSGTIRISSSTFSGNRALGGGSDGGGLYFDGPTVSISNSTISGNRTTLNGGGIVAQDGADVTLNAVTVVRNVADDDGLIPVGFGGGGLYRLSSAGFEVRNSLIARNLSNTSTNDCDGDTEIDSLGNNLLSTLGPDASCEGFDAPGDRVRATPKIGKLKRNGGPTKTVALKKGSPAIGRAHRPSAPNRDQRGRKRGNDPDIGAFERGA